ncbi:MAG: UDP-N-acetylglucosamine--N-acetylmuramyl-(pentapeptide) pyrophosphoryl-undecaprenol N-acetylglucosamine transferase [bacterium]
MHSIIFFTGASGGHILPAKVLRKHLPKSYIVAIKNPVSLTILKNTPDTIFLPPLSLKRFKFSAVSELLKFIIFTLKLKPRKIICFGSYLNLIGVVCSVLTRSGIFFFEPNLVPGKGTRLLKDFADRIFTVFPQTQKFIGRKTIPVKMPVSAKAAEKEKTLADLKFDFRKPVLLILGGSQGSHFINKAVCEVLEFLDFAQIIHITGNRDFDSVLKKYSAHKGNHLVLPFTNAMPLFYGVAGTAVSRAGSGTLAELSHYKIPSLLIPYPQAGSHQEFNALFFSSKRAAIAVEQNNAGTIRELPLLINKIIFNDFWKMKENLAKIDIADDGTALAAEVNRD